MAQVIKKFQNGGTSPTKKYGIFTIDGTKYEVNDDFLNQLTSYGKTLDEDTAYQFSKITDALRSGADLSYDSNANKLNGPVSFDVNNAQQGRLEKRRSKAGRWLGNIWGGKETTARHAVNALKNFKYIAPSPEPEKYNKYDWSRTLNAEYKRNPDTGDYEIVNGRKVYINGANNLKLINRLKDLKTILNYKDTDEFIGYNGLTKQDYINFYNKLGDKGISDLINRIEQGTWTEEDAMALDDIGAFLDNTRKNNESDSATSSKPQTEEEKAEAKIKGFDTKYNLNPEIRERYGIHYGNNGELYTEGFGLEGYGDSWRHAYLGDNFVTLNPNLKQFKDYILYNGRLYSKKEWTDPNSAIHQELASPNVNIFERMRHNLFDPSQNGGWNVLWTNNPYTRYDRNTQYNAWFNNNYKDDNNVLYSYVTSAYQGLPDNINVLDIIDSNTQRNEFGVPVSTSTVALDENGNQVDISNYFRGVTVNGGSFGNAFQQLLGNEAGAYKGWIWKDIVESSDETDENGNPIQKYTGWSILYNPKTGAEAYYDDEKKRIVDPSKGAEHQSAFAWETENGTQVPLSQISYWNADIQQALRNIVDDSKTTRWIWRGIEPGWKGVAVTPYSFDRNRLQNVIPTKQTGGLINWKSENKSNNTKEKKIRDTKKTATTSQILNGDLTAADKWQLGALAGDLSALVTALPSGGNPLAAGLGVGSTLAQLTADIKRDGLDGKDIGNALLGLGLDAITFLPGVGIVGKVTKTAKVIKKLKPLLTASFSALGLTAAYNSLNKNGEWTLDDYRNILSGIQGILGGKRALDRSIGFKKTGKSVNETEKVSAKNFENLQKETADKLVKENPDKFKDKEWITDGKISDYSKALNDDDIKTALPKHKFYNESVSKLQAKYQNTKNKTSDWLTGESKELRWRTESELPWFLQNTFGRKWLAQAQKREFSNVIHRLENKEDYSGIFNSALFNNDIFKRGYRTSGHLTNNNQIYFNPFIKPELYKTYQKGGKIKKGQNGLIISSTPKVSTYVNHVPPLMNNIKLPNVEQASETLSNISKSNSSNTNKFYRKEKQSGILDNMKNVPTLAFQRPYKSGILNYMTLTPQLKSSIKNQSQIIEDLNNTYNKHNANSNGDEFVGQEPNKNKFFINPDMILGMADFITSARAINKTADIEKDAIRKATQLSQQQKPTEFYSRFSDNGLLRSYDDRLKTIRQYKTVSSDPNQVMAERLMRDQQADELINDRNTKFSQLIGEYNDKLLGQKQTYANIRNQIVNENRTRLAQGLMQEAMVDSRKVTQNAQNLKNLIYQFRDSYARDLNERRATEEFINQTNSQTEFTNNLKQLFMNRGGWNAMSEEEKERYGNDWMSYTFDKYTPEAMNLRNQSMFKYKIDMYNDPRYAHEWFGNLAGKLDKDPISQISIPKNRPSRELNQTSFHKTGGKINNRIRPTHEQHYLDQQKAINSAIKDLNNNIVRLFLKMMS